MAWIPAITAVGALLGGVGAYKSGKAASAASGQSADAAKIAKKALKQGYYSILPELQRRYRDTYNEPQFLLAQRQAAQATRTGYNQLQSQLEGQFQNRGWTMPGGYELGQQIGAGRQMAAQNVQQREQIVMSQAEEQGRRLAQWLQGVQTVSGQATDVSGLYGQQAGAANTQQGQMLQLLSQALQAYYASKNPPAGPPKAPTTPAAPAQVMDTRNWGQ